MKYLIKSLLIFLILSCQLWAEPTIKLNKINLVFSSVTQGTQLRDNSIIIKNTGNQNLNLKFQATCDCTSVKADKYLIKPGDSTSLHILLNTKAYNYDFKKSFYIITNDPKHKIISFPVKVIIKKVSK